jgi:hypothetical protein
MDIDATIRELPRIGLGSDRVPSRPQGVHGTEAGQFARVYELAEARRRRATGPDRIPDEVWDDMHRANELADNLAARGQQVRFDTHRVSGRIVASLCDLQGSVLRPIGLGEVLGQPTDPDPVPAA